MSFGILFTPVHPLLKLLSINVLFAPYLSMPLQCGTLIHLVTLNSWKVFSAEQPDGFVEVGGILSIGNGPNRLTCLNQLEWPLLHQRQIHFTICQAHNIIHHLSAIPFTQYFSADNKHSNPSALNT